MLGAHFLQGSSANDAPAPVRIVVFDQGESEVKKKITVDPCIIVLYVDTVFHEVTPAGEEFRKKPHANKRREAVIDSIVTRKTTSEPKPN
jgi:hypothetical protein